MKKTYSFLFLSVLPFCFSIGQVKQFWNHKKCTIVLTYDDAIPQQLDHAIPTLDSLHLKATFYLTAYFAKDRLNDWKEVARKGYELGNHTLFHPCMGGPGREWVKADYDMHNYSLQRMLDEIRMTNVFLQALDAKTKRTFAYTCGDMKIGDSSFIGALHNDFIAARAVRNEMHTIDKIDLYNIDCYVVNNNTASQMFEWIKKAEESHSLLVILFHGVGGGNSLNVAINEHSKFLHLLQQEEKNIWITTMLEAAEYIKGYQERNKSNGK